MEVLTPQIETPETPFSQHEDTIGEGINLKNLQFLNYLGLKDEMFNGKIMEKVSFLSEHLGIDDLMSLDFKVGQDPNMPRIDRIYSYLKLDLISRDKQAELDMINNAKTKWEMQQPSRTLNEQNI